MTDIISNRLGMTHLQRAKSAGPSCRYKSAAPTLQPKSQRRPIIVLHVDENCPLHGSQNNCTCTSFVTDENGLRNKDSIDQNGDSIQQQTHDNHGNNNDISLTNIKPFNNNPSLLHTQRGIVGKNLHFHSSSSQLNNWNDINNEQLRSLMIYGDILKRNLTTPNNAGGGLPKMRFGRAGGHWRHIKQTNTCSGLNHLFIDGVVRVDDTFKYPIPRFGYPPMNQPQHIFISPSLSPDLSHTISDPTTKSLDAVTWSTKKQLNRRPPLSQYSNCYERRAKDGFSYWPEDINNKKRRCKTGTTGTFKTWLGLSDSILKL